MTSSSDNGSWSQQPNPYANPQPEQPAEQAAQPEQPADPYAQPGPEQSAYGEQPGQSEQPASEPAPWSAPPQEGAPASPAYGEQPAADPYSQPTTDPYAQPQQGAEQAADSFGRQGGQPSAHDPYGQPSPAAGGYGSPSGVPQGAPGQPGRPGPQGQPGSQNLGQSRLLVGLLGIFLGGFGVHRFLLGYTTIGIIQIVVTIVTCGVGTLWGLIEGIMILAKADAFKTDAQGRALAE
jgi:TM2 domain-containing membrane protein YozV